jgi:hypothetical protein
LPPLLPLMPLCRAFIADIAMKRTTPAPMFHDALLSPCAHQPLFFFFFFRRQLMPR